MSLVAWQKLTSITHSEQVDPNHKHFNLSFQQQFIYYFFENNSNLSCTLKMGTNIPWHLILIDHIAIQRPDTVTTTI